MQITQSDFSAGKENFLAIEQHLPLVLGQEAAQDTQEGSFAAAAGAEERDELVFIPAHWSTSRASSFWTSLLAHWI